MKESILEDYKKNKKTYHAYRERIINLLTDLLSTENMVVHQLVGRTKSLESLSKKLDDKNGKYNSVDDITDIVGIRIITYLESDIDSIAELVEKEFIKDEANSIDKRKLQADRFGYKSLHVVVGLNNDRTNLKEYKRYKDLKCEIQIRSILQHAWAEIEHVVGYKGEFSIPDKYKRSFNRLAALLETADIEFNRLKFELDSYEKVVPDLIASKADVVDINSASINSFMTSNQIIKDSISMIERKTESKMIKSDNWNDSIINLKYFNILTIADLEESLQENKANFFKFLNLFVEKFLHKKAAPVKQGLLLYFTHYLAAKSQDPIIISEYIKLIHKTTYPVSLIATKRFESVFNIYNEMIIDK